MTILKSLEEYSSTFEVEINQTNIENIDRYLRKENVITQPGSVYTNITKTATLPDYYNVNHDAPDNTPVLHQNL